MRPNRAPREVRLHARALILAVLVAAGLAGPSKAQDATAFDSTAVRLKLQDVETQTAAARTSDVLPPLRVQALALQAQTDKAAAASAASLAEVDARLTQLGPAPASSSAEDPAITRMRRGLQTRHDAVDADVKRAKLLSVAAAQALDDIAERQRQLFNARLFRRGDSPLTPAFWTGLGQSLPPDVDKLARAAGEAVAVAAKAPQPHAALTLLGGLAAALLLLWPVRVFAGGQIQRRVIADIPPSPLRRSASALATLALDALLPLAAAGLLALAARWSGALSPRAAALLDSAIPAVGWGALIAGIGHALLRPEAASWRLAPVSDRTAERLRAFPYAVAITTMAGFLLISLNRVVGASLAATVAALCTITVVYCGLAALALVTLGLSRAASGSNEPAEAAARPRQTAAEARASSGWSLVAVAVAVAVIAALAGTLSGYAVFGATVASEIYWLGLLAGLGYLLFTFIDDLCRASFGPGGWAARTLVIVFALRRSTVDQLGVLVSAGTRLTVLLALATFAFTPFGRGGQQAGWTQTLSASHAIHIGTFVVSPGAILGGLLSLVIGVAIVRAVQGWLERRYLPATDWDAGVRNSVSTAVGYLGMGAAIFWALASAGLGLEKVALIASALSVGIGFGLQQIVQNFVSGLILLAERPVKVGDWVSVSGVEGDVRNIRVRATEIQKLDRSTVLVPNSELVTKAVQNKTLHAPRGRVELLLSIGDPTRADEARWAILDVLDHDDDVLCDPEPRVFIDAVTNGAVAFKCFAYVDGPRDAYPIRSQLYFAVLKAFADKGIGLAGAHASVVVEPGEDLRRVLEARAEPRPDPAPKTAARKVKPRASEPVVSPDGGEA